MSKDLENTIRFRRTTATDENSAMDNDSTATAEFELVSTQMLEKILFDMNDVPREDIQEIADSADEGWLAQDTESKKFDVVKDNELEQALRSANEKHDPLGVPDASFERVDSLQKTADNLCLVSTQHLKKVLDGGTGEDKKVADQLDEELKGFDPYNNS